MPPEPPPHVAIAGGNGQSGTALDTLALPLEVSVVDDEGELWWAERSRRAPMTRPVASFRLVRPRMQRDAPAQSGYSASSRALFPGVAWRDVSVANAIHVISERDSIVFSLGPIPEAVGTATIELVPVPLP